MSVKEKEKMSHKEEQKKMSSQERIIASRYGRNTSEKRSKARTINELYRLRHRSKFR